MCTTRSKRSRSARESFMPYAASFCGEQLHSDGRVAAGAARAQVHRPDQDEPRREDGLATDPRDGDDPVLERLAQRLEHRTVELGQLVEEEDAAVREAHLARTRPRPAADHRRGRRGVVRGAKGRSVDERMSRREDARHRVDARDLERLLERQRRKRGQPASKHRLAGPRRAGEQHVVASCRHELERSFRPLLPAHVREVGPRAVARSLRRLDGSGA